MHNELSLIAAFVNRNKCDCYREFVSNPRLRHKFTNQLAHFSDFDPKYRLSIPSNSLLADNIACELQKRHSPDIVFAISEDPALDQKELPLVEDLQQTGGCGQHLRDQRYAGEIFRDQLIGRTDYLGIERRRYGYRADRGTIMTSTPGSPSPLFNSATDDPRDRPPAPVRPPSALPASVPVAPGLR